MKHRRLTITLMLTLAILSGVYVVNAQGKTSVSGTWKMNAEKSKFERGGPKNIQIKFDQQSSTLHEVLTLSGDQDDRILDFTYTLDGKESPQQLEGRSIKTIAKWEGEALSIEFKDDEGFSFLRKITVSSDGKVMTIAVKQTNPNGSVNDTVILDKQ